MGIEIEAKMRLADRADVERRLRELGAEHRVDLKETNTFFDTADSRLKSGDHGLRVRVEELSDGTWQAHITHKGPRAHGKLKSRTETEVGVEDAHAAARLLEALGYFPVLTFEKRRRRWLLDGCRVELDTLPHLGDFIEIEGPSDEAVLRVRERLGMDQSPLIRASYIAMLLTYLREKRLRTDVIKFEA